MQEEKIDSITHLNRIQISSSLLSSSSCSDPLFFFNLLFPTKVTQILKPLLFKQSCADHSHLTDTLHCNTTSCWDDVKVVSSKFDYLDIL